MKHISYEEKKMLKNKIIPTTQPHISSVILGFVDEEYEEQEKKTLDLTSPYMPNKIGGKPAWLNLKNIPTSETLACSRCSNPRSLLVQLYCPLDKWTRSYHRILYVFACKNGSCHRSLPHGSFLVLRCQLAQKNLFYPEDVIDHPRLKPNCNPTKSCRVCGLIATKHCSRCKTVSYCGIPHQRLDWYSGKHKIHCQKEKPTAISNTSEFLSILFREIPIVTEPELDQEEEHDEEDDSDEDDYSLNQEELAAMTKREAEILQSMEVTEKQQKAETDKSLFRFKRRMESSEYQDQILRYYSEPQTPLWVSDQGQADAEDILPCSECGAERRPEFQLTPQLLYFLKEEKSCRMRETESLDFGTLVIYTCSESCATSKSYVQEWFWRQQIPQET